MYYDGEEITDKVVASAGLSAWNGIDVPAHTDIRIDYTLRERLIDRLWDIRYKIANWIYPIEVKLHD